MNGRQTLVDSDAKVQQMLLNGATRLDVEVCDTIDDSASKKLRRPLSSASTSVDEDVVDRLCDVCGDDLTGSDGAYGLGHFKCLHCTDFRICCGCEAVGRHDNSEEEGGRPHFLMPSGNLLRTKITPKEQTLSSPTSPS